MALVRRRMKRKSAVIPEVPAAKRDGFVDTSIASAPELASASGSRQLETNKDLQFTNKDLQFTNKDLQFTNKDLQFYGDIDEDPRSV